MIRERDVYLEHYGKKGMKWGIRKASKTSSETQKPAKEQSDNSPQKQNVSRKMAKGKTIALTILATAGSIILPTAGYVGYEVHQFKSALTEVG